MLTKAQEQAVLSYCYNEKSKQKYVSTYCSYQCIDCQRLICNGGQCYGKKQNTRCQGYTDIPVVKPKIQAHDIAKCPNGDLCYVKRIVGERCLVVQNYQSEWYLLDSLELYKSHQDGGWR